MSAPRPSLDEAPIAEGTIRCLLILRHVAGSSAVSRRQTKRLDVFYIWLFLACFSGYAEQSLIPQEPFGQTVSVKCQRATREGRLVHRGQCRAHLRSRMRSHSGKKLGAGLDAAEREGFLDLSGRHG